MIQTRYQNYYTNVRQRLHKFCFAGCLCCLTMLNVTKGQGGNLISRAEKRSTNRSCLTRPCIFIPRTRS